ncbi:MAG: vitamin transporter [Campylobacterota bacterium]|nr:vitamin transporter [Campylobacterota bacterium]
MNPNTIRLSLIPALLFATNLLADATLEPITVVSSNKTEQSVQKTTSNVEVITAEEIKEKGYQNVAEAIEHIAGISVVYSGGLGQQTSFFVRGADSGKVLVLLDGMRLNDPSTTDGRAILDNLTVNAIKQIEIIKGGASSIWGSNASAGVINIVTKTPKNGVHGSLAATYGSYSTRGIDADIGYKDQKFMAQLLASILKTDGFSALAPRDAEDDGYTNNHANLKLGYAFDAGKKLSLGYHRIKTDTRYDDAYSAEGANDDYSHADSDQENIAADYCFSKENYEAALHASKGTYDRSFYTTSAYWGDGVNRYHATLKEYSFINAYTYSTNGKAVLGLEHKDIDGFNQYNDYPASQSDFLNQAIFLSNTYLLSETTLLETSLRYDHYDAFESKTTYKIGIKHEHPSLSDFTTGANFYTSYDAPSSYQLANPVPGTLLKPSFTKGYELYARYKEWLSIAYFDNKIEDNIDYDMAKWGYYNVEGTSKFEGIELAATYKIPDIGLVFSANYTHLFTYEKEDGTSLARRPKDTLNASVDYYTDSQSHYGIDAQYTGNRKDMDYNTWPYTEVSTGNYILWNLHFGTEVMKDTDLTVHAKNIFDKEYQSVYGYATEGRAVYAKITYNF